MAYPVNGGATEIIKGSLADTWADKPLAEINDVDVHTIVRDARDHGIPGMDRYNKDKSEARGRAMHSALSLLFKWLLNERWPGVTKNPPTAIAATMALSMVQSFVERSNDRLIMGRRPPAKWLSRGVFAPIFGNVLHLSNYGNRSVATVLPFNTSPAGYFDIRHMVSYSSPRAMPPSTLMD